MSKKKVLVVIDSTCKATVDPLVVRLSDDREANLEHHLKAVLEALNKKEFWEPELSSAVRAAEQFLRRS